MIAAISYTFILEMFHESSQNQDRMLDSPEQRAAKLIS